MAPKRTGPPGGQEQQAQRRRRFVTATSCPEVSGRDESKDSPSSDQGSGALMSPRAAISGVGMGAGALLCFVLAAGFSGGQTNISEETQQQVFSVQEQIRQTKAMVDELPEVEDADRGLVTAQAAAEDVADLQNQYRYLTPAIAAADGVLDADRALMTRRNLTPYFDSSVDRQMLQPWYLLASDAQAPMGLGIPMSFESGFRWIAQRPFTINKDATIEVTWLARLSQADVPSSDELLLAWAQADYDPRSKTFLHVRVGTTTAGQALRQEVKSS